MKVLSEYWPAVATVVTLGMAFVALRRGANTDRQLVDARATADLSKVTADLSKLRADELQAQLDMEKQKRQDHQLEAARERAADQLRCTEEIAVLRGKVEVLTSGFVEETSSKIVTTVASELSLLISTGDHTNGEQ